MYFKNFNVLTANGIQRCDLIIQGDTIHKISHSQGGVLSTVEGADCQLSLQNCVILPGLVDVHVHLREPGFFYKESIATGTQAGASAGYTALCAMPNLNPYPDSLDNLAYEERLVQQDAIIDVYPFGCITVGERGQELVDFHALANRVAGFSDDGKGVQRDDIMLRAMRMAKQVDKVISAHCEDETLLQGGCVHDGEFARQNAFVGISSESEYAQVARDIELARQVGHKHHICHISTKESVELIRKAKADGVDITCETAPHYLLLTDMDICDDGKYKMNPPLRSKYDRQALINGIIDGTIDIIATDHAPHSNEEKSKGLRGSAFGISGLEVAFPLMYTHFVKTGTISLVRLLELMSMRPAERFSLNGGWLEEGKCANFAVFDLNKKYKIDSNKLLSKGKCTPFDGWEVYSKCIMTVCNGRVVWKEN